MVDIAVCDRRDCPKKDTCFRYLAERDEYRQSKLDINSFLDDDKDVYTFEALFGLIDLLSDEAQRDVNKDIIDFDAIFAEDKVNLDSVFIAALKKFYQF